VQHSRVVGVGEGAGDGVAQQHGALLYAVDESRRRLYVAADEVIYFGLERGKRPPPGGAVLLKQECLRALGAYQSVCQFSAQLGRFAAGRKPRPS
jgi:hypothetical protein